MPLHSARVARNASDTLRERFGRTLVADRDARDHEITRSRDHSFCDTPAVEHLGAVTLFPTIPPCISFFLFTGPNWVWTSDWTTVILY